MGDLKVTYPGEQVDVTWDGRLCIHVGECGRADGELFQGGRKPWCAPDVTEADDVIDVCKRCPTGALSWQRADGTGAETAPAENRVVVANNGPLYLTGELQVAGAADDMEGVPFRAALCRCGLSKNKPFCDNSHERVGFIDRGAIGDRGPGTEATGGPLVVGKVPNGPLLLRGNVTLVTGAGRVAWTGTKCALCRCGQSANKPFCDGSHKAAGFQAD
ncbi:MAG: CDGSH-type Zn-finger protein/uncharacterized Fe-S cluster protein YjdI [Myxococcota bacterium]|jgi:CDGSH-type Zn-finger protein/uncharacterized Fe-S cluster protein YjdI